MTPTSDIWRITTNAIPTKPAWIDARFISPKHSANGMASSDVVENTNVGRVPNPQFLIGQLNRAE
jgi:hypothetical protein